MSNKFKLLLSTSLPLSIISICLYYYSSSDKNKNNQKKNENSISYLLQNFSKLTPFGVITFRSFDSAAMILRTVSNHEIIISDKEIMDEFYKDLTKLECDIPFLEFNEIEVISLEGLSGCGKSTLANVICKDPSISRISLPEKMSSIRCKFSKISDVVAVAFDYICLYYIARSVVESNSKKCIITNYYHSYLATNILNSSQREEEITGFPKALFEWPKDLPRPSITLFLVASSETRVERKFKYQKLGEEKLIRLRRSDHLNQLAYSLIKGPIIVAIDADNGIEDLVENAYQACELHAVYLRDAPPFDQEFTYGDIASPERKTRLSYNKRMSLGVYGALSELQTGINW